MADRTAGRSDGRAQLILSHISILMKRSFWLRSTLRGQKQLKETWGKSGEGEQLSLDSGGCISSEIMNTSGKHPPGGAQPTYARVFGIYWNYLAAMRIYLGWWTHIYHSTEARKLRSKLTQILGWWPLWSGLFIDRHFILLSKCNLFCNFP